MSDLEEPVLEVLDSLVALINTENPLLFSHFDVLLHEHNIDLH